MGVISCRISVCYFPLPLVPSRRGRGKFTFYETIIVEGLTKYYGNFLAVDHVSFNVNNGEPFGFLGPNGAGKTTTVLRSLIPSEEQMT